MDMPKPVNVKGVQRFLGLGTYLSKIYPLLSDVCEPLRRLTDKDAIFSWQNQQEKLIHCSQTAYVYTADSAMQ